MQQSPISDQNLMAAVVIRDEGALKQLYDRYGALIYSLAYRKLGDRGLAEEVLQDVMLRCWEQAASYRPGDGSVSAWLFGIARNRAIDMSRGRQQHARAREQELPVDDAGSSPHERQDIGEAVALHLTIASALADLPIDQRKAIELAYYADMSQTQIAQRLGEPLGTIKTRMRAGMEKLRRSLLPGAADDSDPKVTYLHD